MFDFPAVVDYVLEISNSPKLHYISHSVGSKNFMAGLTLRPEYNDKISVGVMMGPAGFMTYMFNGYARLLGPILRLGQVTRRRITVPTIFLNNGASKFVAHLFVTIFR